MSRLLKVCLSDRGRFLKEQIDTHAKKHVLALSVCTWHFLCIRSLLLSEKYLKHAILRSHPNDVVKKKTLRKELDEDDVSRTITNNSRQQ